MGELGSTWAVSAFWNPRSPHLVSIVTLENQAAKQNASFHCLFFDAQGRQLGEDRAPSNSRIPFLQEDEQEMKRP